MEHKHEEYILSNLGKLHVKQIARDLGLKERTVRRFIEAQKRGSVATPETSSAPPVRRVPETRPATAAALSSSPQEAFFRRFFLPVMLVLGCAAYSNSLKAGFHFDDLSVIINNKVIRDIADPIAIMDLFNTRALVGLSFALNYALHQLDVTGYHIVNIAIHLGAAALVWGFALALFRTPALAKKPLAAHRYFLAFFAGLLFALHPVQTMAVTYIWQRVTSMATLFYLLSLISYIRARTGGGLPAYALAAAACLAAMFAKEISATLPLAFFLVEALFFTSESAAARAKRAAPFLIFLAVIPLTFTRLRAPTEDPFFTAPTAQIAPSESSAQGRRPSLTQWDEKTMISSEYRLTQINVARTYLRLFVLPVRQSVMYSYPRARNLADVWPSLLLHAALLILALRQMRSRPLLAFGIFWFYLNILIEAYMPLTDVIFEHRAYLPMVGFALIVPAAALEFAGPRKAAALLAAASLMLGSATFARNLVWKDDFTLWSDASKKFPNDPRPYSGLGYYAVHQEDFKKAVEYYEKVIELDKLGPNNTMNYFNLGRAYLLLKNDDKALENFEMAIVQPGGDFDKLRAAYNNAAAIHLERKNFAKAAELYEKILSLGSKRVKDYTNLGTAYLCLGDRNKAIENFEKAIAEAGEDFNTNTKSLGIAYTNAAAIYEARGDTAKALDAFQKAVRANPKFDQSHAAICELYLKRGDANLAIEYGEKTLRANPEFVDTRFTLGLIYHQAGRPEEGWAQVEALRKLGRTDLVERLERTLEGSPSMNADEETEPILETKSVEEDAV